MEKFDTTVNARAKEIESIANEFPDEFEVASIQNHNPTDTIGVELIDTAAARELSKYYEDLIPLVVAKITKVYVLD